MDKYFRLFLPPIIFKLYNRIVKTHRNEKKCVPEPLLVGSYSQYGEDLILDALLQGKENGFYIDVGAFDPEFQSNTQRFYLRGWRGLNIEPMVNNYNKFVSSRPRDINVNCGVHLKNSSMTFYELEWGTLSSFDKQRAMSSAKDFNVKIINEYEVRVRPLSEILIEHKVEGQIDFMTIDTEGNEMNVLRGGDWERFRPRIILVEPAANEQDVYDFLVDKGYRLVFKNQLNSFFIDRKDTSSK